jgi:hypothetical protein
VLLLPHLLQEYVVAVSQQWVLIQHDVPELLVPAASRAAHAQQ